MGLGGGLAHVQAPGDLVVGQPAADKCQHLPLLVGQLGESARPGGLLGPCGELPDQPPGDARGQQSIAVAYGPDGLYQLLWLGVLDQEPAGPGPDRLEHVPVELERGQDNHPDAGQLPVGGDLPGGGQAVGTMNGSSENRLPASG
jgi:hypothetical protein